MMALNLFTLLDNEAREKHPVAIGFLFFIFYFFNHHT